MRVAVTGRSGQIASSLSERGGSAGHTVIGLGRPEFDLADPASVMREIEAAAPDVIVSAAAYTAVDQAESECALAYAVNADGARAVAGAAARLCVPVVHLSTDYVFDGGLDRPYRESDQTAPASVYGASKLAGEKAVLDMYPEGSAVLRTAWVYAPCGRNFVRTMLRLAEDRDEIEVVADQIGNPSSALAIADGVLKVAANLAGNADAALRGVFHMAAQGEASWADLAEHILAVSRSRGGPSARVRRIATADYPTPARRPANSRLDCGLVAKVHGVVLPDWRGSVEEVISRLNIGRA